LAVIQREHDGVRWQLEPDFAPLLEAVLKSPGELVKESPVKRVTVHSVGDRKYYIKRYLHSAVALRPLKFFFKSTQADQEWQLASQLEARGIPIVRHLALGERRTWSGVQESILITEGFEGTQLDETPGVDPAAVQAFVERMHEQGVLQVDLHPANLLVHRKTKELRLVDLHGTVVKARLSAVERDHNLAVLRTYLPIRVTREIEQLGIRLRRERLYARSRRCLRHNRDFGPMPGGGLKWQVQFAAVTTGTRQILAAPDPFLSRLPKLLKDGRSATVGAGGGLVLKRFNFRRASRLFKDLFRSSPAFSSFRKAYHLELLGIATARPVAAAERRFCRFLLRSYFLMEEIPGAVSLLERLGAGPGIEPALIESVACLIGRLHREGFSHRDLKATNIVLDAEGRPRLIDLDGLSFVGEVSRARARKDLERLARSVGERLPIGRPELTRFLKIYSRTWRSDAMRPERAPPEGRIAS
jgi:tRNA A-37 threonylcarbamoyl transferase component Bud32